MRIILCADDYGYSSAVSEGIMDLVRNKRLSGVSCMTNMPDWQMSAKALRDCAQEVDVGLHFNLTEGKSLANLSHLTNDNHFLGLQFILWQSQLRRLAIKEIILELNEQLDCFVDQMRKLPDFIDGHQHIHHLPVVREALLQVYDQRLRTNKTYVRAVVNLKQLNLRNITNQAKILIIYLTGAIAFKRQLIKNNIPHNSTFSGFYNFSPAIDYAKIFAQCIAEINDQGLIMCHPGKLDPNNNDPIAAARWQEYCYFNSEDFVEFCNKNNIVLARFV